LAGYCIVHPSQPAFISAFSPEGVGQFLMTSGNWPAGRYVIRMRVHGPTSSDASDPVWGYAIKDSNGDVLVEPADQRP
jgi:hypothetical protein